MNDITSINREERTGRFVSGCKPGPGRPRSSRNKLSENFIADVAACWEIHGKDALERLAVEDPGQLLRCITSLMPKDVSLSIGISADDFSRNFAEAVAMLGNEVPQKRRLKVINGNDAC